MLAIRPAESNDLPVMLAIYGEAVLHTSVTWEVDVPTLEDFTNRFEVVRDGGYPWLVATEEGQVVGYCYAGVFRGRYGYRFCCETTIYLHPQVHGRGIGGRLYQTLIEVLTRQGFVSAIGGLGVPNPASEALHERLGFRRVGTFEGIGTKFGEWLGATFYQRDLAPRTTPPPTAPIPFANLLEAGQLDDLLERRRA